VPSKFTIQRLVERFRETGSTGEKRRSGRHYVRSNDSLEDIRARLLQSPRESLKKLYQQTGIAYGSVQRATKRLKLHPYRGQVCHELKEIYKDKRMRYCRWFRQFVRNGADILENVSFSDEAWFHLSGYVNSQNFRLWSSEVAISNISQETLKKVVRNMVTRVNTCYAENGGDFQHLL
jgi:hypothetical protein